MLQALHIETQLVMEFLQPNDEWFIGVHPDNQLGDDCTKCLSLLKVKKM